MKPNVLYSAFLQEFNKMYHMQREVIDFLPKAIKAGSHPHLIRYLEWQWQEAQHLLETVDTASYIDKKTRNADVQNLITACGKMLRETRMGRSRDICIKTFAGDILAHEIECLSCLVSMADKLGIREKDALLKSLRRREALRKKLLLFDPDITDQKSATSNDAAIPDDDEEEKTICLVEVKKNTQTSKSAKRNI